jgi:hypothetical protein
MADQGYIETLQRLIAELHGCLSRHVGTVSVHETFLGNTLWVGNVEVFAVIDHPRAQQCFAWASEAHGKGKRARLFAVLATSVIRTPLDAVKFVRVINSARLINELSRMGEHE